jgi:hypothetical protein
MGTCSTESVSEYFAEDASCSAASLNLRLLLHFQGLLLLRVATIAYFIREGCCHDLVSFFLSLDGTLAVVAVFIYLVTLLICY